MYISIEHLYSVYQKHRNISTDSRQIKSGCLFFALKGDNFDGNKYADIALKAGASFAVIDDATYTGTKTLLVNNVLETLQQLALFHRRKFNIPVIAITGSNGKTTTKELVYSVLSQQYHVTATKGNLNNHIGVPITLLNMTDETQVAIIEMGANHQLEIESYCKIAEPTHGLITNIGKAHLGGFGGQEGVIKAKSELYSWLRNSSGRAFVNARSPLLMELTAAGMNRTLYGNQEGIETFGKVLENTMVLKLDWLTENETIRIETNLVGNYNFENVMAAISIGSFFKISSTNIKTALGNYVPSNSRSQSMKTANNWLILDAYNANPSSMQVAIENFRQLKADKKMLILGDMLELGNESPAEHIAIVNYIEKSGFDMVVLVGADFTKAAKERFICFPSSSEAFIWLQDQKIKGFSILVKGSRGIKMERVLEAL